MNSFFKAPEMPVPPKVGKLKYLNFGLCLICSFRKLKNGENKSDWKKWVKKSRTEKCFGNVKYRNGNTALICGY